MSEQNEILFDKIDRTECPSCHGEIDVAALEAFSRAACPACGAEFTVPAKLSNYRLLSCLGSGGMGSVYRAYDETLAREVAIKVMKKSLGQQTEFLESFRREAQAAAKLNHPNIAQIYSFGEEHGQPYIVMEYVPGKHLEDLIEGPDQLPIDMVMKIGLDIADGLQLATASNLIHGDIKPGNILMDDRNAAKLVDFGIASSPDAEQTEIWGTPYYISPEKIKREKIDFRSDMYCLGGTLYHAITKKPPFDGEDAMAVVKARLAAPPRPLREYRPDTPAEVERIIMRTLEADPAKRYASYGDLMADISAFLSKGKTQPVGPSSGGSSKRIIIKSRNSRARTDGAATDDSGSSPINPPTLHVPGDGPGTPENASGDSGEEKKGNAKKIVGCIVGVLALLLLAGGGGTFAYLHHKKAVAAENARLEREALIAKQDKAIAGLAKIKGQAETLAERVAKQAKDAEAIVAEAVKIAASDDAGLAATITADVPFAPNPAMFGFGGNAGVGQGQGEGQGEGVGVGVGGGEGVGEEQGVEQGVGVGEEQGVDHGVGVGQDQSEEQGVGEAQTGDAPAVDNAEGEGEDKGEEAAAEGTAEEASEEKAEEATTEEAAPEEAAPVADAVAEPELEGLPQMARGIFLALAPIRQANALAGIALQSVESMREKGAGAIAATDVNMADLNALKDAVGKNIELVESLGKQADGHLGQMAEMVRGFDDLLIKAREALDGMKAAAAAMEAERERLADQAKAEAEARAEKERKEAAEAARHAAEEAEIEKARAIVPANSESIANWKIDHVIHEIEKLESKLETKPGLQALKIEKRRMEGLRDLKEFLAERLASSDHFVHPRDKWTVVAANPRSIEIKPYRPKDAKPQRRKWEELKPAQIIPMLIYYLGDKDKAKSIPLRERVAAYTNMAIYFVIARGDDAHAIEAAKDYCNRAISDSPSKRREIEETLYELHLDEAE